MVESKTKTVRQHVHTKVFLKIDQIARYRVAGVKDGDICSLMRLTRSGLSRILGLREYKEAELAVQTNQLSLMDKALAGRVADMRQFFRGAVPAAMRGILETALQGKDLKTRIAACAEILDRDPDKTFAKNRTVYGSPENPIVLPDAVIEEASLAGDKVAASLRSGLGDTSILVTSGKVGSA